VSGCVAMVPAAIPPVTFIRDRRRRSAGRRPAHPPVAPAS
jgi:hypothetical protein